MIHVVTRMPKQKVTLSLDPEIYQRTRDALSILPGTPSISALVDQLLDGFATTVAPALSAVARGESQQQAMTHLFGAAFDEAIRIHEEEEAKPASPKK